MGFSNFFRRKSILPGGVRPVGRPLSDPSQTTEEGLQLSRLSGTESNEIFSRPTLAAPDVPDAQSVEALNAFFAGQRARNSVAPSFNERQTAPSPAVNATSELLFPSQSPTGRTLADLSVCLEDTFGFLGDQQAVTTPPEPNQTASLAAPARAAGASIGELYALGDFSGALALAEVALRNNPQDPIALRYAEDSRRVLLKMCEARLSPLTRRAQLVVGDEQMRWLALDHREGFLLSLVDGHSNLEELVDISGMDRLEVLRSFAAFVDRGIVTLK
jgi:hypothetical protein